MSIPSPTGIPQPLVGRERELGVLRQHLDAAIGGYGRLVLIGGEAGIGKTALAEVVCREATQNGVLVLVGRCYDLTETPPYGPWVDLFGRCRLAEGTSPLPEAFAHSGAVGLVSSQAALFQQVLDFSTALAETRPLVLLLDDLHWADPASLDLLRFLARSVSTLPLLILATYRSEELTRRHPLYRLLPVYVREAQAARLDLRPLDDVAIRALVDDRYRLAATDATRLVAYLRERGEGNALFIGELLRSLEETDDLHREGERWVLGDLGGATVPPLLWQVIDARIDRLDEESQRLLAVAAVIGQRVAFDVWQAVGKTDEEALLNVVAKAEAAHILIETADGQGAAFTHALIREALYDGTRPTQRRQWHEAVGELLAATPGAEPDAVAYHLRQAGDARAVDWLIRAGEHAQKTFAWLTAAERYEAAIALLVQTDTDPDVRCLLLVRMAWLRCWSRPEESLSALDAAWDIAERSAKPVLVAVCLHVRGIQRCRMGQLLEGLPEIEAAALAIDVLPADDLAYLASLDHLDLTLNHETAWGSLILRLGGSGRTERAMALGLPLIAGAHPSASLTDVHFGLAYAYAVRGECDAARQSFAAARAGCRARNNPAGVAQVALSELEWAVLPYATDALAERQALADEANAAWIQVSGAVLADVPVRIAHLPLLVLEGAWEEAWQLARALGQAQRYTSRRFLANRTLGPLAVQRGDRSLAWAVIRDTLPRGHDTPMGDARFCDATVVQRTAVALALEAGELAAARAWLEAHDRWLAWSGAVLGQSEGAALWAEYHRKTGDAAQAYAHAERALAHATEPRQPLALLTAHRLLGELDTEAARFTDAETHLTAALSLADACAAPYERALTLLAQAELRVAEHRRDDTTAILDEVRAICTPLGAMPALARADAITARLTSATPSAELYPDDLTPREVDVLRLIAAGRSNREIAATLFISSRTVNRHIENLYRKIGAHGKADATAYAFRHQLT
jgi:DNA-binding CsgD family transcriptional regulator